MGEGLGSPVCSALCGGLRVLQIVQSTKSKIQILQQWSERQDSQGSRLGIGQVQSLIYHAGVKCRRGRLSQPTWQVEGGREAAYIQSEVNTGQSNQG